ncbi:long-chain fatty acid--CoA ligase [Rhodococcus oryzae]|uniref:acyl-CoA synthetase n=1 Tax=Rhodococcus oryzae TaxID=2571143 RepID=UPI003721F1D3
MYLTHLLHRAMQQTPELIMTVDGDRTRTVREVGERVSRLAGALRGLGVKPGGRVAILAANSDRYHEVFLATWWCGGVVNPVNARWSDAELAYALRDAEPAVLLIGDSHLPFLGWALDEGLQLGAVIHCGESGVPDGALGYEQLIAEAEPIEDIRLGEDAIATLLYTGGTTGFPKGVMMSHRAVMTSAVGYETAVAGGVSLLTAPMFHIAALSCWLTQNYLGGTAVFLPSFEPRAVLEAIETHRVTSLTLVPTMLQMLLDCPELDEFDTSSLWTLGYGASAIPTTLLERAMRAFPNVGFVQGYGTTETAIVTALSRKDHLVGGARLRSVGRPVPHCEVRIADPSGAEVARGDVGEILVRGDGLMRGYWNQPEQSDEALRCGWMHTGDAAYMDSDGYVFIVDRMKDMIISGGENIFSSEVENVLVAHPAVSSCAVIGLPDERWGERVHAVVALRPGVAVTVEELKDYTAESIARYKVPKTFDFVDTLPVSAAGKVLKRDLRDRRVRGV